MKLREHRRNDHELDNESADETLMPMKEEMLYRCDFCNAIETNESALDEHVAKHEGQFKCVICGAILKHKGNLVLHMRIHVSFIFHSS